MEMNIEKLVENRVAEEIEQMDIAAMMDGHLRDAIRRQLQTTFQSACERKAKAMIEDVLNKFMDEPVETDDGWGDKEHYDSFTDLFRKKVKQALDSSWDVKRTIEKLVDARCNSLIKQDYDRICEKITDEITKSKLIKKK